MENLNSLKKNLIATNELKNIVLTMKSLSGANIKKYEKMSDNIAKYLNILDSCFQAILQKEPKILEYFDYFDNDLKKDKEKTKNIYIAVGSNQGLCGRFNDKIVDFYLKNVKQDNIYTIVIGDKLCNLVKGKKINIDKSYPLTTSKNNTIDLVYSIVTTIENFIQGGFNVNLFIIFKKYNNNLVNHIVRKQILPFDKKYFENLKNKQWMTNNVPNWKIDTKELFTDLSQQYLFANLFLMVISSMASEQKERITTLQSAEQNMEEYINNLTLKFNQTRQTNITSDLIDTVSGFLNIKRSK